MDSGSIRYFTASLTQCEKISDLDVAREEKE